MDGPKELSLAEIRKYMLENDMKITNHALVKYFKKFLTHPDTQNEARKEFKTYVNILATIKNENNQKYLILRKKYVNECPSEDVVQRALLQAGATDSTPSSPGAVSLALEGGANSPFRQPPPYKAPPQVNSSLTKSQNTTLAAGTIQPEHSDNYRDCVQEFASAMKRIDPKRLERQVSDESKTPTETKAKDFEEKANREKSISRTNSVDETASNNDKENIPRFSFSSGSSGTSGSSADASGGGDKSSGPDVDTANPISVKEATRKFNRMASEEEARIISPPQKKKAEQFIEEKVLPEVTLAHPKAKEWIVAMAKCNYQELAKLSNEHPELVKLQDPSSGYTALHWAAKHGNEDVVKLIAGTHKADVNARTNGGYTPLHMAMQFGRSNIFALLCNTYKADRDIMDWSGNKPLDYSKQQTSVSASTYSKIKAKRKPTAEKDLGFLRIGSLNVRVKKTTEAFSNFLGVGNGNGSQMGPHSMHHHPKDYHQQRHHRHHHYPHLHHQSGTTRNHPTMMKKSATMVMAKNSKMINHMGAGSRASVPINPTKYDMLHKSWGSADNVTTQNGQNTNDAGSDNEVESLMPPPKALDAVKKRSKTSKRFSVESNATDSPRDSISSSASSSNFNTGYSSMPTTPNQLRSPLGLGVHSNLTGDSDSDSACGFDSSWSISGRNSLSSGNLKSPKY